MELRDILPQKVPVKLERLDRPLYLNMMTLDDIVWMQEQYPGEELQKVYTEFRIKDILRIISRGLASESKRFLATVQIEEEDECGEVVNLGKLTLADKLLKLCGEGEIALLAKALNEVKTRSNEIALEANGGAQKKTMENLPNGNSSSTL